MTPETTALLLQALGPLGGLALLVYFAWKAFLEARTKRKVREQELSEARAAREESAMHQAIQSHKGLIEMMSARIEQLTEHLKGLEQRITTKDLKIVALEEENEQLDVRVEAMEHLQRRALAYIELLLDHLAEQARKAAARGFTLDPAPGRPEELNP